MRGLFMDSYLENLKKKKGKNTFSLVFSYFIAYFVIIEN